MFEFVSKYNSAKESFVLRTGVLRSETENKIEASKRERDGKKKSER